ncbi:MAG: hypothetical protein CM15mP102_04700 [Flavobacteriales bacterium]|nr:MAG: hypothetical protein CM15mP102_04700 [Flavobacteriales bacterium]
MHDSKIRPETMEIMSEVEPKMIYTRDDGTTTTPSWRGLMDPMVE